MSRKDFYLNHLVPSAQLLVVLSHGLRHTVWPGIKGRLSFARQVKLGVRTMKEAHGAFAHAGRDALNLVNAEVAHWTHVDVGQARKLAELQGHLDELFSLWSQFLNWLAGQVALEPAVLVHSLSSLKNDGPRRKLGSVPTDLVARELEHVHLLQGKIRDALWATLGYSDATRHEWLSTRQRACSPLLRGQKPGSWQTLWRNLPWEPMYAKARLRVASVQDQDWTFGSRVGRERVPHLVQAAFLEDEIVLCSRSTDEAGSGADVIPAEISLDKTSQGMLRLTAHHTVAATWAASAERSRLAEYAAGLAEDKRMLVEGGKHEFHCAPSQLVQSLDAARAWLNQSRMDLDALQAEYQAFEQVKLQQMAVKRLNATFSAEDIARLRHHFLTEEAGTPAA